jgi:hypothetical protein
MLSCRAKTMRGSQVDGFQCLSARREVVLLCRESRERRSRGQPVKGYVGAVGFG